jgi:UDP-GlcNAc:undecaprenyl-phosphate GlcNAc-1-phosphate transferase
MDTIYIKAGWIFISSLVLALILTPASIWLAKKAQILDYPGKTGHTVHKAIVPKAGGMALFFSLTSIGFLFGFSKYHPVVVIFLAALVILIFGLWDDRFKMNAPVKLTGQLIAVTLLVINNVRVQFFENPQFFININPSISFWIDIIITYLWVIAITNAFNLMDSMDGLALGLAEIITSFFIFSAFIFGQQILFLISTALLGVNLGIFFYNRFPAKTFLGDSGAQTLGFILSAIAIIYTPKAVSQSSTWFVPIILFGVPIFDTTLVTVSRAIKGIPIYKANLDHTYHRLIELGWKKDQAITSIHITEILCGLLAALCVKIKPPEANILFALWILIFLSLLIFLEKKFIKS